MTKKKLTGSALKSINFERYNVPIFREHLNKPWVTYGVNNIYPLELLDLYNQSAVHNAIINGKVKYIVGKGLTIHTDQVTTEEQAALLQDALKKPNPYETWNDIFRKISQDYEVYNGFAMEYIRNNSGKIVEVYHADFSAYRVSKDNDEILYYSEEWDSRRNVGNKRQTNINPKYKEVPKYNPFKRQKKSIYYYAEYRPNIMYYPLPTYVGAVAQIETSVEIANFDLNAIKYGFSGGTLVSLNNGMPESEERMQEIYEDFHASYSGSENANRVVLAISDDKEHAPSVENLQGNDISDRYEQLDNRVKEAIFIGHGVTSPMLFGVRTEGQLGGRTEILEAYELFKETYIQDRQRVLLSAINDCMEHQGLPRAVGVEELQPLKDQLPLSEATLKEVIPAEVLREEASKRFGIKLPDEVSMNDVQMAKEPNTDDFIQNMMADYLETVGEPRENFVELRDYDVLVGDEGVQFAINDLDDIKLTDEERRNAEILRVIEDNPMISNEDLAQLFQLSLREITIIIGALIQRKLVASVGSMLTTTEQSEKLTALLPNSDTQLEIRYRYAERPDAKPTINGSRPFCRRLMASDRLYTREEIEGMRNNMTRSFLPDINDVWKYRGGWYRSPGTDVSVPFCRHVWQQTVVRRRR